MNNTGKSAAVAVRSATAGAYVQALASPSSAAVVRTALHSSAVARSCTSAHALASSATEVVAVTVVGDESQEELRACLALGADRAILAQSEGLLEPLAIAKVLTKIVESENPNLIILGKQAIDGDNNQTGQMLAA